MYLISVALLLRVLTVVGDTEHEWGTEIQGSTGPEE